MVGRTGPDAWIPKRRTTKPGGSGSPVDSHDDEGRFPDRVLDSSTGLGFLSCRRAGRGENVAGRTRSAAELQVKRNQRTTRRHLPGVAAGQVTPQCPYPFGKRCERKQLQVHSQQNDFVRGEQFPLRVPSYQAHGGLRRCDIGVESKRIIYRGGEPDRARVFPGVWLKFMNFADFQEDRQGTSSRVWV